MGKKQIKASTIVNKLAAAVAARIADLVAAGEHVAAEFKKINELYAPEGKNRTSFENAVDTVKDVIDFDFLLKIIGKANQTGANDSNYVQAKVIEKINKLIFALANRDMRSLDRHTASLMVNAMLNGKLTSKAAFATLVKIEWGEEISEMLKERNNYTAGTGSTQLSSTKEAMRILGLSENPKGTKNADFTFTDDAKALFTERFERIAKVIGKADEIDAQHDEHEVETEE
jgi:hypothetical protein